MMSVFKPTELHAFLQQHHKKPSKRLSQNFLIDGNILRKIVKVSQVQKEDRVIEIGPGPGALTEALLEKGVYVTAIEKDPLFAKELERLQTPDQRLQILPEDALTISLDLLFQQGKKAKIVANLPYQITTPLLARLAPLHPFVESITVMIQKEVAERLTAQRGTAEYGSFTLFLEYFTQPSYCFTVKPSSFFPVPRVHSALIQLQLKTPPLFPYPEKLIRTAFGKRRKMLRSSLRDLFSVEKIQDALKNLHLSLESRPEELSLNDFLHLQQLLV
jgi:16S rRNA (adenine1518-N6/adenine1519-N6)-dimethyltransferase